MRFHGRSTAVFRMKAIDSDDIMHSMKNSILIVDDDERHRENLARYLSGDYTIHTAANGREALEQVRAMERIGLILSDINMPGMDGIELLKQVNAWNRKIITIFITGSANDNTAIEARNLGAYDFLSKPTDLDQLVAVIHKALAQKAASK